MRRLELVVPYIPQVAQAFLATGNPTTVGGPTGSSNTATGGPTPQVMPSRYTANNPFLGGVPATQQNMDNNGGVFTHVSYRKPPFSTGFSS